MLGAPVRMHLAASPRTGVPSVPHPRVSPAVHVVALAAALAFPAAVSADGFVQVASVPAYRFHSVLRQTDGTGPGEMVMVARHPSAFYSIFNINDGTLRQEFPDFGEWQGTLLSTFDYNDDGRSELYFHKPGFDGPGGQGRFDQYRWNGSSYVSGFTHTDDVQGFTVLRVRTSPQRDIAETSTSDLRVRDSATGAVLWRASTSVPNWIGAQPYFMPSDLDGDGVHELVVVDRGAQYPSALASTDVFRFSNGSWVRLWGRQGWEPQGLLNTDSDPQAELVMQDISSLNGQKAIVDGLTGATELALPATDISHNLDAFDGDGDGRTEIYLHRQAPASFLAYEWNGAGYTPLFSHTDPTLQWGWGHFRNTAQNEIYEYTETDLRIRDLTGTVLFRASTDIPGWSPAGLDLRLTDVDQDGVMEFLAVKGSTTRHIRYSGQFSAAWTLNGPQYPMVLGNTDGDPQHEIMFSDPVDKSHRLHDGLTGALEKNWAPFTTDNSFYFTGHFAGTGPPTIMFHRMNNASPLPYHTAYRWNGSSYEARFAFPDSASFNAVQARDGTQYELLEAYQSDAPPFALTDILLRDALDGRVLFHASRSLAGWAGLDPEASPAYGVITIHERGTRRIFLNEPTGTRFIQVSQFVDTPRPADPLALRVFPSAPNPFRDATTLSFELPRAGEAGVRIYDAAGRLVRRLDRTFPAGRNTLRWDGLDDAGRPVPSGVLFYDVIAGGMKQTHKLVRLQ